MADVSERSADLRVTPARGDLAAIQLAGKIDAPRFVEARLYEVVEPQAPMRRAPSPEALLDTEALHGERLAIYDVSEEGWAWGQLETDGYVGFVPAGALREAGPAATHRVSALRTLLFPGPSTRLAPLASLSFGCRLVIARKEDPFLVTASGAYAPLPHVVPLQTSETDFVAVAERFVGTPYLWGGRTSLGLDCSALVQLALAACNVPCPRDSDMQEKALGEPVALPRDLCGVARGDLVFWRGHVAIIRDEATLLHANAFHMAVAIEPIGEAIPRILRAGTPVTSVRRIGMPA
jgi:cell wall-associated NlpC family hydrolase